MKYYFILPKYISISPSLLFIKKYLNYFIIYCKIPHNFGTVLEKTIPYFQNPFKHVLSKNCQIFIHVIGS